MGTLIAVFFRKVGNLTWTVVCWAALVLMVSTSYHWLFFPAMDNHWAFWPTVACAARTLVFVGISLLLVAMFLLALRPWNKKSPTVAFVLLVLMFCVASRFLLFPTIFHLLSPTYYK